MTQESITITCNLFASHRCSRLPGTDGELSYQWLFGEGEPAQPLPILPPAMDPKDELQYVLIADPSQIPDPNARRDDLASVEVGSEVQLEMVPPDPNNVPPGWSSPIEPTQPGGAWKGDRFVFEPCYVDRAENRGFDFRITVTVRDKGGETKVYSVDPEVYVGTGGGP